MKPTDIPVVTLAEAADEPATKPTAEPTAKPMTEPTVQPTMAPAAPLTAATAEPTPVNVDENTNSVGVTVVATTPKPQTAPEEDALVMDMSKTGMIYAQTLEQIKEQGRKVVLEMNDQVSWSIDGSTIENDNLENINLEVELGNSQIPERKLEILTEGETYVELSLAHNGEFGFTAVLSVELKEAQPGQYANLFYYNEETGEFEFMCASLVSSTCKAEFEFKHASEYVIIISDDTKEMLVEEKAEVMAQAEAEAVEAMAQAKEELPAKEPRKAAGVIALILLGSIAIVIGVYLILRRKDD